MTNLWKFIKCYPTRYSKWYLAGILFLLITNLVTALIPRKIEKAIDVVHTGVYDSSILKELLWLIFLLALFLIFVRTASRILIFFPGRFIEFDLRRDLYAHLLRLDDSFYNKNQIGDLMSRVINDIQSLRLLVGFGLLNVMNSLGLFCFVWYQMYQISWYLFLITWLPIPLFFFLSKSLIKVFQEQIIKSQSLMGKLTSLIVEVVGAIPLIRSFSVESNFKNLLSKENDDVFSNQIALAKSRARIFPLLAMMGSFGTSLVFIFGGSMVLNDELSLGKLVAFSNYMILLAWPISSLGWLINVFQRGISAWDRINSIFKSMPKLISPKNKMKSSVKELNKKIDSIELKGISLWEPKRTKKILNNISFKISRGQFVGFFGQTGSGKTILARVLARLSEFDEGDFIINATSARLIDLDFFHRSISFVPQNSFLFSASISQNVAYSSSDNEIDTERVKWACNVACFEKDVHAFEDGYETIIGQKGVVLSGGQKNRLAYARALYKFHDILILDDVLSAVDFETESKMIKNLIHKVQAPIKIVISHRVSILRHCDLIFCLEGGQLVDSGTHLELCSRKGSYMDTWDFQKGENDKAND